MRQYAGFGTATSTNERFKFLLRRRSDRLVVRVRSADADGLRQRPSACGGRGRQGRRRHRLDRRHAPAAGRHPARHRVDEHDHQLHRRDPAAAVRAGRRGAGRAATRDQRHDPERHPQGVHRPRHLHLSAAAEHADHHRQLRVLRRATCRSGTRSRSPATTSARPAARRCRRSRSPSPTASPTSRQRSPRAWTSTRSRHGSASSGTRTTTSSRRSPSSARRAASGTG